jgi:hypothetical protein
MTMPSIQDIFNTIKQVLPRRSPDDTTAPVAGPAPITESEAKIIEQTKQTEKSRWTQIVELGVPALMLVIGLLLTVLAELIGLWGILGFLLLVGSPVVFWLQRVERKLGEVIDELRRNRPIKR